MEPFAIFMLVVIVLAAVGAVTSIVKGCVCAGRAVGYNPI
jgi:hypothetical protein